MNNHQLMCVIVVSFMWKLSKHRIVNKWNVLKLQPATRRTILFSPDFQAPVNMHIHIIIIDVQ